MVNVCYENNPFQDPRDVILMSQMAVSEVVVIAYVTVVIYGFWNISTGIANYSSWSLITPYLANKLFYIKIGHA